jgi:hypothetical protein
MTTMCATQGTVANETPRRRPWCPALAKGPGVDDGAHGPALAKGAGVDARTIAAAFAIAAFTASAGADAGDDRPIFVTVVGQGTIRLRLAVGVTAPCDSTENRMLFDERIGRGKYRWETGAKDICYQYTSRALPDSDWSVSRVVPTRMRAGPLRILLSAE